MDDLAEIKSEIKEVRIEQHKTNIQLERYNTLLDIHIKGVKDLDLRVAPIETHIKFMRGLAALSVKVAGIAASCATIIGVVYKMFH